MQPASIHDADRPGPAVTGEPLAALLAEYGGRWQISPEDGVWVAVRRPTPTAIRVIAAHEPTELAKKLAEAEATE